VILALTVLAGATLGAVLGARSLAVPTSAASPTLPEPSAPRTGERPVGLPPRRVEGNAHTPLGVADGDVPDGVTVFDVDYPAVAELDPALLRALRQASANAAAQGVEIHLNSGWRSPDYQERLLEEAVATYGSRSEAAKWVATPSTSPHVAGGAVDVGPADARDWLAEHGAAYGLCRIYANEPWHYELRPRAADHGCPTAYADPTHDPRMHR
jgi:LAS superfamily LD-carboxypeptidase LdcB